MSDSSPSIKRRGRAAAGSAASRADRAAERRAAIVQAAMDEFIARGFAATRLDDIARRAGVAKGTIYLHFKDKESMFE
ncbi:MAG: helix-turn-helix domain-containing protein, partial [Bradyrhizobium sp.]|nr:helix-turn-helix domain-containing protein [Bradyrhizobium sp.]